MENKAPFIAQVLPDGNFEVRWNGDIENDPRNLHDAGELLEALGLIGNGYESVAPEWIGALTDDPWIFTDDLETADDGTHTVSGKLWHWPDYQIRSPMDVLADNGKVIFPLVPQN